MIKGYRNRAQAPDSRLFVLRAIGGGGIVRVLAVLVSTAASVVLARALGPAEYGIYALVFAGLTVLALPVQVGLPPLIIRETASNLAKRQWAKIRGLWAWSLKIIAFFFVLSAIVIGVAILAAPSVLGDYAAAIIFGAPLIALIALCRFGGSALNGLQHIITAALPDQVLRPLALCLAVLAIWLGKELRLTAEAAMIIHAAAAALAACIGLLLLRAARPEKLITTAKRSFDPGYWRRAFGPLIAIAGMTVIMQHVDLLMLGAWRTAEEAGFYKIAVSGATLAIFGLRVITLSLNPRFAQLSALKDRGGLAKYAAMGALASVAVASPVLLLFVLWGYDLISLVYGAAYSDAFLPLIILMAAHTCVAATGLGSSILSMTGRESVAMRNMAIAVVVNIALNALLIPDYGIAGAALATGLSLLMLNLLYWRAIQRLMGFDCSVISARRAFQ